MLQPLTGLRPQAYEHPSDKSTLDALQRMSSLDTLVRKCNEFGLERLLRVQLMGSYLRATQDSFPDLYRLIKEGCEVLDIPKQPQLYLQPGGLNAFTAGVEKPIIVLNAGLVDQLSEDQLRFVIGHELGHIKSGHVLYYQIAVLLPIIAQVIDTATLGLGGLLSIGLQVALVRWQRMSELTADRAGLLACQDVNAAIGAMIHLAGLPAKLADNVNTEDFIAQARDFEAYDSDKLDWIAKILSGMGQTHPWTVMRAHEFLKWIDAGAYDQLLKEPRGANAPALQAKRFCTQCGAVAATAALFCVGCGMKFAQS
jgi:Zn-dependent protease with chaperone function